MAIIGGFILILFYLSCMLLLVQYKQDTSIANFTWGGGCTLLAIYTLVATGRYLPRQLLVTALLFTWCSRMGVHLYLRYTGNDPRFVSWQRQGLRAWLINLGYIFGGQLVLLLIMSVPGIVINVSYDGTLRITDFLGAILWLIGFCFEAISDEQLRRFLKNPDNRGRIMRYGLWRYSRHPNYFGEVTLWWGIFLLANNVPYGSYALVAPVTITVLLLFVTGIPLVEKVLERNPEYWEYKERTSGFIPWFCQADL